MATGAGADSSDDAFARAVLDGRGSSFGPRRIILTALAVAAALALLIWGLPALTGASWGEVLAVGRRAPLWLLVTIAVVPVLILLVDSSGLHAAIPGLPYRDAVRADAAATAVGLGVPGGGTLALVVMYAVVRRAGVARRPVLLGALLASLVDLVVSSLLPAIGLLAYLGSGIHALGSGTLTLLLVLEALCLAALVIGAILLRGRALERFAHACAEIVGPLPLGPDTERAHEIAADLVEGRDGMLALLRRRPLRILVPPLVVRALQAGILLLALRGLALDVPLPVGIAVFALGRVLAMVPLTPGGAGIAEGGTAGALIAAGQPPAEAAAAALLASVGTLVLPLLLGALAGIIPELLRPRRGSSPFA